MRGLDPSKMSERENYKFLTGSVIPRPVALVTTLSPNGVVNAGPFSYFNIVAANPPLLSISVQRVGESRKDTAEYAVSRGEFVVHIGTESYVKDLNQTAARLGREESELTRTHLHTIKSERITVPGIKEAPIRMECELEKAIELGGSEGAPACDLLIGRVLYYHINENLYQNGRIDAKGLNPISRLAGNDYALLGDVFELVRPK